MKTADRITSTERPTGTEAQPSTTSDVSQRPILRLSSILAGLCAPSAELGHEDADSGAGVAESETASATHAPDETASPPRKRRFHRKPRIPSFLTIGQIVERTSHAGFGFILAFLALVSVPFFGLSAPFGLAVSFVALQMIIGLRRPWLPRNIRKRHVSITTLNWLSTKLARWTAGFEKIIRPRFTFAVRGPFWIACGVALFAQGIGLALPLPIPGSNWVFIFPILVYAIGLLEDDGLLIMAAHALTVVQVALIASAWNVVVDTLKSVWSWGT